MNILKISEDGKFVIEDIRIEDLDSYILKITEIKAPENYTLLREPIELRITPGIKGEYDDAEFVLENIELISGENDGLVKYNNTEEKIELEITNNQFDLALRKYITSINGKEITRWKEKEVDTSKLITGEETTAEYYNGKLPLRIYAGQEIIYTLRVYNEGQIDGYVTEIVDYLPEQLEFLPDDEFNTSRGWSYVEGDDTLSKIKTNYLSKDVDENKNLIKALNAETGEIDYVEVAVKCKVKPNAVAKQLITNIAEITKYEAKDRPNAVDRDSEKFADIPEESDKPTYKQDEIEKDYVPGQEDDDDFEKVIVEEFDLVLRKFITEVNGKDINSRIPEFKINSEGQYVYEHDKTPVEVAHNNLVEYTIRVYNEGTVDGYANLVKDDIPEGLVFVRNNEINKQYKWKLLDANGNETKDILLAEYIVTDYLSKENGEKLLDNSDDVSDVNNKDISDKDNVNLIKAFDSSVMDEPDYRDLKVVFEVNVPNRTDDIIMPFKMGAVKACSTTNTKLVPFIITGKYKMFKKSIKLEFLKPIKVGKDLEKENQKFMNIVSKKLIEGGKKHE